MHYRLKICLIIRLILTVLPVMQISAQAIKPVSLISFSDSIDQRVVYLQNQINRLKQTRDVAYLNFQRELDHTLFVKKYHDFVVDENLDQAKSLVESLIKKADFRKDQSSVTFYRGYEENIYNLIKNQRMHYQLLFKKTGNLKKEYEACIAPKTIQSYQKAQRMISLALKYAHENNLEETIRLLETYDAFTKAIIFDEQSEYDLAELSNKAKSFEKVFLPLAASDSIEDIREAEELLSHCINYGSLTGSSLNGEYFNKKAMILTSALSDLLDRQGREKELARYTNQSVVAFFDTLNPCGVFKWHDQIIVIDEFVPTASMENVKKGEAIIHADKMLATYLEKNKLCHSAEDIRFGYSFIIPYQSNAEKSSFYFNKFSQKWQFIACYTLVVSESYTSSVTRFMPPLFFENEMNTAQNLPN